MSATVVSCWICIRTGSFLYGAFDGNTDGEYIHIGYSGSIHNVGGSLSIKNRLAENVAGVVVREERMCGPAWVSIGDSYRSMDKF